MIPAVLQAPHRSMHCTYDESADVMYVNFEPGAEATDSELGPDDVIVHYRGDEIIGLTILHASRRSRVNGKQATVSPSKPTNDAEIEAAIRAELPWLLEVNPRIGP